MISEICLKNFKCFQSATIKLGKLTVLTGVNSTGKSTVLQSVLAFRQWLSTQSNEPPFNGYWLELGRPSRLHNVAAEENIIELGLVVDKNPFMMKMEGKVRANSPELLWKVTSPPPLDIVEKIFENFNYLSAERLGPRESLPMWTDGGAPVHIGKRGEFVAHFLHAHGSFRMQNENFPSKLGGAQTLAAQVDAWLNLISPGATQEGRSSEEANVSYVRYPVRGGRKGIEVFRPANVGFGLSYTLPVLVALLSAQPNSIVVIENPEAHLHPAGQTALGKLMAMAANAGVQVIVETHSDHIVDGIRLAVKDGELLPDDAVLHYFSHVKVGSESEWVSPKIKPDGKMSFWPDGFFDESIKNLTLLNSRSREIQK